MTGSHRRRTSRRLDALTDQVPEPGVDDTAQETLDRQLVQAALQSLS
ncbi:MAG: hypothetical protein QOD31_2630, partial [Pseudonocardiales bacterium]|nr:hypothetical protein [Pseudonocardiales bacterium]